MLNTRIITPKHQINVRLASLLGSVALAFICTAPVYADTQIQLTSPILGGSVVSLMSYSQNASSNANTAGRNATAVCGQVAITKLIDKSSPTFLKAVLTSLQIQDMTITFSELSAERPFTYYTVRLQNVVATSITQSDSTFSIIVEQIVLSANRFQYAFTGQNPDGGSSGEIKFGFNCATQTAF